MRLKTVKRLSHFKAAILILFVRNIDEEKVTKNLLAFHAIDAANSG